MHHGHICLGHTTWARKTKSSRLEGPKAVQKGCKLEVGPGRDPRLLVDQFFISTGHFLLALDKYVSEKIGALHKCYFVTFYQLIFSIILLKYASTMSKWRKKNKLSNICPWDEKYFWGKQCVRDGTPRAELAIWVELGVLLGDSGGSCLGDS